MTYTVVMIMTLPTGASLRLLLRDSLLSGKVGHQDLLVLKHLSLQVLEAVVLLHSACWRLAGTRAWVALLPLLPSVGETLALVVEEKAALWSAYAALPSGAFPLGCLVGAVHRLVHLV